MRLCKSTIHGVLGAIILTAGIATPMSMGAEEAASSEETVEVRIKLPDGSTVVQKAKKDSSRVKLANRVSTSKRLSDGSRVSVNSSSGSSVRGRTSGARSKTHSGSSSAGSSSEATRGVVVRSSRPVQSAPAPAPESTSSDDVQADLNIPTVGAASHDGNTAFGGQTVNFEGTGMYGAVIGRTIYLVGVELAHADQPFEVARGTRIMNDSVIRDESDLSGTTPGRNAIESRTHLKMTFEAGAVVNLVMYSDSSDSESSSREERTWTVQVR
jgi:hypothetical protein